MRDGKDETLLPETQLEVIRKLENNYPQFKSMLGNKIDKGLSVYNIPM